MAFSVVKNVRIFPVKNFTPRMIAYSMRSAAFSSSSSEGPEALESQYIASTYCNNGVRLEEGVILDHGKGVWLYDTNGKKYLDFSAGIAVSVLGHGNKEVQAAVSDQIGKLAHSSNIYHTQPPLNLAKNLIECSPGMSKVFFSNSGTEANEGALKFAKIYSNLAHSDAPRTKMIGFQGSFHGRSLGALSLTYKPKIRVPFTGIMNPNVVHVAFNDIEGVEEAFNDSRKDNLPLAVVLEPVQGEGGINPAQPEFMKRLRQLCDYHDTLLIFDEVQIGFGRAGMGKMWAYEVYDNIVPDILTCAKPIAAGLPMGAILLSEKYIQKVFKHVKDKESNPFLGLHGSTFAGNPVCAAAANVVLKELTTQDFLANVASVGKHFIQKLLDLQATYPEYITKVNRPLGDQALYAGLVVTFPVDTLMKKALNRGLMILSAGDYNNVIRLCPPLIISESEVDAGISILATMMEEMREAEKKVYTVCEQKSEFENVEKFEEYISNHSALPKGFSVGTTDFKFIPVELGPNGSEKPMKLALVKLDEPSTDYAALFTSNKLPGAPVKVGKQIVASKAPIGAIIVNNKISNVHPKGGGVQDVERLSEKVCETIDIKSPATVFPASTGVIGWSLPIGKMIEAVPDCARNLDSTKEAGLLFSQSIMTTDCYPKACSSEVCIDQNGEKISIGRITGFAKGAGMIEPNLGLATMLVFILTDIDVSKLNLHESMQQHLEKAINAPGSLNRISIDSDQSTSDTVLFVSSSKQKLPENISATDQTLIEKRFQEALATVCKNLAHHVIRNGEGVEHVIKATMLNCLNEKIGETVGRRIVNSPLVKTAIAGNDPNVGRILCAVGNALASMKEEDVDVTKLTISIGSHVVFQNAEFDLDETKEAALIEYFKEAQQHLQNYPSHGKTIDIEVDFNAGKASTEIIGADLTHGYITENAEYRS